MSTGDKLFVGMMLHCRLKGMNNDLTETEAQPFPVVVTYIHSKHLVNVAGWNSIGGPFAANNMELLVMGAPLPASGSYVYRILEEDAPRIALLN